MWLEGNGPLYDFSSNRPWENCAPDSSPKNPVKEGQGSVEHPAMLVLKKSLLSHCKKRSAPKMSANDGRREKGMQSVLLIYGC
jgi:hypothetical protein